jgi:peptidoglycan/xylan/chitin deacetylase (PgdA/CDA1 family)
MKLKNAAVLETIFAAQGNFRRGRLPSPRRWSDIEVAPFKDGALAACCISTDFEMGWGWRALAESAAESMGQRERMHVPLILGLLEEYSIPITWATVGHLFLESCTRSGDGLAHADMPRPSTDDTWSGEWYAYDPCADVRRAPSWYAPDLIRQILDSSVHHEIGTHSFSHVNFSCSPREVVERELASCVDAMRPFGLRPRSLVFPRNRAEYTYLPLLASAGITAVRHRDREHGVRLSYPERAAEGVYKIYESMNLRTAKHYDYLQKVKLFVRKAMTRHAVYALWFHPSDPTEWFERQFREILDYLAHERRGGRLWVTTMQDLAAYCEAREQLELTTERTGPSLTIRLRSSLDVSRYGVPDVSLLIPASSNPRAVSLELLDGCTRAIVPSFVAGPVPRVMVNIPPDARQLRLMF